MRFFEKWFKSVDNGGLSTCYHDSNLSNPWGTGYVLSNCTGLAWSLFNIDHNRTTMKRLTGNAGDIYAKAKKNGSGFKCSYEPKAGSIACYGAGTKAGHVVYVLHMWSSGNGVGIESNYSGNLSNGLLLRVKTGNPKNWYKQYQGCIYDFT